MGNLILLLLITLSNKNIFKRLLFVAAKLRFGSCYVYKTKISLSYDATLQLLQYVEQFFVIFRQSGIFQ